ncbi:class I SAM-dependent methyltransferase [Conexibacter woesei]|uniref:class I SAM-dependent methyltransferase n=1 Tax=Conexibacter woesei TaxID=191495 RepID=UPI00047C747C|nr:class I SAM-dependent methyltransferase [Conexibacter woesei]
MSILDRARDLTGYDEIARLRQAQDTDWVLALAADQAPRSVLDLGCGTGTLLARALERWPDVERVVGIDGHAARVDEAGARLSGDPRVEIRRGDLLSLPALGEQHDVVALTSVLHWLYPDEALLYDWVARHLAPGGSFLLTTHHPHPEEDAGGRGAEDVVVAEALAALGAEEPAGAVPISERTRTPEAIAAALDAFFEVDAIEERYASQQTASAEQHAAFHASTFGTYFSRLVPAADEARFFDEVGRAAWRRQQERGEIYPITVRLWRARPRARPRGSAAPR